MTPSCTSRRRRASALVPVVALTSTLLFSGSGPATAAPSAGLGSPAEASATWAAAQLTDGTHASGDHGLTADIVMGLAATGTGGQTADKATDWLEEGAEQYISRGVSGDVNAGATAKLALVAGIEHRDATDFGGVDLLTTLTERMQDNGRFTDDTASGDLSNQFTQSLAVLALQRVGEAPAKAVDFLANTQCADGGYPLSLRSDPTRCNADVDSTGLAIQALLAVGRTADAASGLTWLEKQQGKDGGFAYGGAGADGNSNSTALAVQALVAGERTEAADQGVAWLRTRQLDCDAAAKDRGAVGYMKPEVDGTTLRATAQVIPALAGKALGEIDSDGRVPDLAAIECGPGNDNSGGTTTGDPGDTTVGSIGDTSAGSDGGLHGGTTTGGTDGGFDGGTTTGSDGGTGGSGGLDPASTGGSGDPRPDPDPGPDGGLASSGSHTLPLAAGAGLLLLLGVGTVLAARLRLRTR